MAVFAAAKNLFLLRNLYQLFLGFLQFGPQLLQMVFQVFLRIRGRVKTTLDIRCDKPIGHRIRGLSRELRRRAVEVDPHQSRIPDRLDVQAARDHAGHTLRIAFGRRAGCRFDHGPRAEQLSQLFPWRRRTGLLVLHAFGDQLLRDALGQGMALQQFVLGLVVIEHHRIGPGGGADLHHLGGLQIDLHGRGSTINRRGQQRRHQHGEEHDPQRRQYRPFALEQDPPVAEQIQAVIALPRLGIAHVQRQRAARTNGSQCGDRR